MCVYVLFPLSFIFYPIRKSGIIGLPIRDGQSSSPLNAAASRDDIVRANNGAYVGAAEDY